MNKITLASICNQDECLDVLRVLSDKTRQKIIMIFMKSRELRANDIAANFSLSRPTVSHHLNLMKKGGVLSARKTGKEVYYSFNKSHVINLLKSIISSLKTCC